MGICDFDYMGIGEFHPGEKSPYRSEITAELDRERSRLTSPPHRALFDAAARSLTEELGESDEALATLAGEIKTWNDAFQDPGLQFTDAALESFEQLTQATGGVGFEILGLRELFGE